MIHDQCCKNQPTLEVLYLDPKYNEGHPQKICKFHWEQTDENGIKFWQRHTKEVKILEAVL